MKNWSGSKTNPNNFTFRCIIWKTHNMIATQIQSKSSNPNNHINIMFPLKKNNWELDSIGFLDNIKIVEILLEEDIIVIDFE